MYNNNDKDRKRFFQSSTCGEKNLFFDVRETKASDYLTITESKKFTNDDGTFHYKKHKIDLYKEDFNDFGSIFAEMVDFIIKERGEEVISERHQKNFEKDKSLDSAEVSGNNFTDLNFEDI